MSALPSVRVATGVVLAAASIGLLDQFLFFDAAVGINVPIAVAAVIGAAWLLRSPPGLPARRELILPAAAVGFAAFVAIRGDPILVGIDLLATLALVSVSLVTFRGVAIFFTPLSRLAWSGGFLLVAILTGIFAPLGAALRVAAGARLRPRLDRWLPVMRGILIALPLVVLFAVLFSAADAVFAATLSDLLAIDLDLGDLVGRTLLAVVIGWLAGGALAFVAGLAEAEPSVPASTGGASSWPRLGATEATVVLGAVVAVFGAFVVIQGTYLFGGLDTLEATGLTYAEYARRGFFELVAVAFLAGGLIWVTEGIVAGRPPSYRGLAIALALLTGAVLASSFLRLRLYQEAYGWTELRFYVFAAIGWLTAGVVLAVAGILRDRTRLLPHGMLVAAVAVGLAVNVIGPQRFVATANVERALNPSLVPPDGRGGLDAEYLASLGDDAVPVLVAALPRLEPGDRRIVVSSLHQREWQLSVDERARRWPGWNLGRERARALLEPIATQLAEETMAEAAPEGMEDATSGGE